MILVNEESELIFSSHYETCTFLSSYNIAYLNLFHPPQAEAINTTPKHSQEYFKEL